MPEHASNQGNSMRPTLAKTTFASAVFASTALPAFAHPGHGEPGILFGFVHPILAVDHLIAMLAVLVVATLLARPAFTLLKRGKQRLGERLRFPPKP
jgi:hydrogenase/urease accessory protein HupE